MIMEFTNIQTEVTGAGIGVITLSRPEKRNAISIRMRKEISACLDSWEKSESVRAVILTGAGTSFSAGFDLDEFGRQELAHEIFETSSKYHRDVWNFPKPIIAAVNGPALGGGFDLATLCDIRICTPSATFGHPEIKFGAPPLFTPLRWIIGEGFAREMCLTGRKIDAQEARQIGLVSEIADMNGMLKRATQIGTVILEAPQAAIQFTKKFLIENSGKGFEESFRIEHDGSFKEFLLKKK
jgi:enoyl-CoA hydratase